MKKRIYKIKGKNLVVGDPNELSENEILVRENNDGTVELSHRNNGTLETLGSGGSSGGNNKIRGIYKIFCEGTYADYLHYFDSKINIFNSCVILNNGKSLISDLDLEIDSTLKRVKPFITNTFRDLNSEELSYITQFKETYKIDCEYFNSETILEGFDCKKINCSDWGIISSVGLFTIVLHILGMGDGESMVQTMADVVKFVKSGTISSSTYRTNLVIGNFDRISGSTTEKNGPAFGYLVKSHIDLNKLDFSIFPEINKDMFKLYLLEIMGIATGEMLNPESIPDIGSLNLEFTIIHPIYLHLEEIKKVSSTTLEKILLDQSFSIKQMLIIMQYIGSYANI